ncbi:flagellar basal body L-ring protein FlgH [Shewanella sp. 1_MG-2023]|uniref:Flagellar basal body L-ring protein FlgH n=1 Tax=Shewanella electrodiphila TaxID=934143 RepID=A0ABT0KT70_9GAMM|nr:MULTISPECIES: flagellar basal body L-ring protein FlgH [Shewanella]MCC4833945.1 flagellar basal body L-ring protein FlgH [Shewanella sp. 10N.7]MCL1047046.1 flagellar basal body L-ring protein FlgH [Shewanella electrodiphila]MDO6613103.1 flagellar basal body L-ring protein FlgH [Shewanella sp. 7_MG-2023]MDO6772971.1 flagellar basal body L-ring protein FlgH [Shewanella sp. 2_MG-2023]MDO6795689.1 flagellar basal body L-ring protein FlgH [Shewanella sp. 1_MG-2023]
MKLTITFAAFILLSMSACTTTEVAEIKVPTKENTTVNVIETDDEVMKGDPQYRPVRNNNIQQAQQITGSIFNPDSVYDIYQNNNRYDIGDMILIRLNEEMTSKKSVSYTRDSSNDFELSPNITAGNINIDENNLSADYSQDKSFDSSSASNHNNSLSGTITVAVREKLPNGNLVVAGEKWLKLNKGDEYVRFSGEIRVTDIGSDHSIDSSMVGNTVIEVSGKGEQQDNQDPSLISKLLNVFG